MAKLSLKVGRVDLEARYAGDLTQPIDPRQINYSVNYEVPVFRVAQEAPKIERPDPEEELP